MDFSQPAASECQPLTRVLRVSTGFCYCDQSPWLHEFFFFLRVSTYLISGSSAADRFDSPTLFALFADSDRLALLSTIFSLFFYVLPLPKPVLKREFPDFWSRP